MLLKTFQDPTPPLTSHSAFLQASPDPHHLDTQFLRLLQQMPAVFQGAAERHANLIVWVRGFC